MSLKLIDYSEKAFAVIGETKPHKDKLKELGGRFNPHLKCGAGWIFSKKKLNEVTAAFVCESPEVGMIPYFATLADFVKEQEKPVHVVTDEEYEEWLKNKKEAV